MYILPCLCENVPCRSHHYGGTYKTNEKKCISCGRCVVVCPEHARLFGGLLYKAVSWKFEKAYSEPKQPEFFYVNV